MKTYMLMLVMVAGLLSGCSALDQVNQSVNYVSEVTSYINSTSNLSQNLPELTEQALTDPQAREQLSQQLANTQSQIDNFNQLEPPAFAQDLHQQLSAYSATLGTEVNSLVDQVQAGKLTVADLNNSQIFQTVDQINGLLNQFQQLGQ
ncbi:DUF6376 family protein [Paenibacillus sp. WLX1005]|uniref:DUF6376 family protein n=1 Tax=Paenibacillus sp. WLX1005 TaxID=3243766 RepID=UPI00398453DE